MNAELFYDVYYFAGKSGLGLECWCSCVVAPCFLRMERARTLDHWRCGRRGSRSKGQAVLGNELDLMGTLSYATLIEF